MFFCIRFSCAKLTRKDRAHSTLLASACKIDPQESFDRNDLYTAMDASSGHWCDLKKGTATGAFQEPVNLVLYDHTRVSDP